jgi:virginiamycin B lyase
MRKLVSTVGLGMIIWSLSPILLGVSAPIALTGIVRSDAEGAMEGVLVSAKRIDSTITVTVVSDKLGRYTFPQSRLTPGVYQLKIRAIGYGAADPNMVATVGKGKSDADIKLNKTRDLASQLMDAEWLMSVPGTHEQKERLYRDCVHCHQLTLVFKSRYDAAGWQTTILRMRNWAPGSSLLKQQLSPIRKEAKPEDEEFAKYLSSINLSSRSDFNFELKTLPRPHGEDTKVIVTEYDLPRPDSEPHDAEVDREGMVWYNDFAEGIVGRLNPRTGEVKEWQNPLVKPGYPGGFQGLELDAEGNPWVGRAEFSGFAKFDKKTEKFVNWGFPPEYDNPQNSPGILDITRNGKVWVRGGGNHKAWRLDPATGQLTAFDQFPADITFKGPGASNHGTYGIRVDSEGNEYGADFSGGNISKIDGQTGEATLYPTPTPNSGPRRMHMDPQDRLWIGEYFANRLAMFDTKTGQFQEWPHPIPWYGPYDVAWDKNGNVWTGSMSTELITRLNPRTGEFRNYLLPRLCVNVRRVDVDNSSTPPTFWVGENRQAKIAKVEPLE